MTFGETCFICLDSNIIFSGTTRQREQRKWGAFHFWNKAAWKWKYTVKYAMTISKAAKFVISRLFTEIVIQSQTIPISRQNHMVFFIYYKRWANDKCNLARFRALPISFFSVCEMKCLYWNEFVFTNDYVKNETCSTKVFPGSKI